MVFQQVNSEYVSREGGCEMVVEVKIVKFIHW